MEVFRGSMFSWFVKEHYYQQSDVEGYKKARLTPESVQKVQQHERTKEIPGGMDDTYHVLIMRLKYSETTKL